VDKNEGGQIAKLVAEYSLQLGEGDLSALGRLYDATAARLLRYAEALTRNREDAEDALQYSMIRVAKNPRKLGKADHPWAYFLKIVRNESLKIIGRRKPMHSISKILWAVGSDVAQLEREEWRTQVQTAIKRLPAEQAEVVALKVWENMTFLEISVVLGESPNTAASRYRYALEKLSRFLHPIADEVLNEY